MNTPKDIQRLEELLLSNQERTTRTSRPEVARINLTLTIPQLDISPAHVRALLSQFSDEVEAIIRVLFASILIFLKQFILALPQILFLVQVARRIPQAVSLVLRDNITFEDALGRIQSLQYQHFRYWEVFQASLLCHFQGLPGFRKVQSGQFILTCPPLKVNLTSSNWRSQIQPGLTIQMSISIKTLLTCVGQCPRGCISKIPSMSSNISTCSQCGLVFGRRESLQKPLASMNAAQTSDESIMKDGSHSIETKQSDEGPHTIAFEFISPTLYATWLEESRLEREDLERLKRILIDSDDIALTVMVLRRRYGRILRKAQRNLQRSGCQFAETISTGASGSPRQN